MCLINKGFTRCSWCRKASQISSHNMYVSQKLYKRASVVGIFRITTMRSRTGLGFTVALATERREKRKSAVSNAGRSLPGPRLGSGARPKWHIQQTNSDERQAENLTDTHSSTYTIYVYINSWLLLFDPACCEPRPSPPPSPRVEPASWFLILTAYKHL